MRSFIRDLSRAIIMVVGFGVAVSNAADKIPGIGPAGEVKKVHGGFQFTEGPTFDREGNLYFSDVRGDKLYEIDAKGELSTILDPSHHTNGLMMNAAGKIVACEMDGRLIEVDPKTKQVKSLADSYEGKRFNAPNDLVIDRAGGIYFTDPHFSAPMPLPQGVRAFYYRAPDGKVTRLAEVEAAPNGIILSPDEKTLYVIPTLREEMMSYPITAPGKLGPGRVFCKLAQLEGRNGGGGDGCAVDSRGNLYIASGLGVQVFDPQGKALGVIALAKASNCKFGGPDFKTLYVTAQTKVYAVPMEVAGIRPQGASAK